MTTYLLLLLLPFLLYNNCTPNGATASYPSPRRKHVSRVFQPQDCNEEGCLGTYLRQQEELQLRVLLNGLNAGDYIMDKRVPLLESEEEYVDTNPVPCFCHSSKFRSRDLGKGYYPRYLSERACENSLCGGGSIYCCIPLYHKILVLKNETSTDSKDGSLPGFMRSKWKFEGVNVTVACTCEMKL